MYVPAGVEYIGEYAFCKTNDIKIYFAGKELPQYVQENWDVGIAGYFLGCLEYVTTDEWEYYIMPDNNISLVTYKGDAAVLKLDIIDGYKVAKIGARCFYNNNELQNVVLGENITEIGNYAFYKCGVLEDVYIPNATKTIGKYAFAESAARVFFDSDASLVTIDEYAFYKNETTDIELPDSVITIGECAFKESALQTITISEHSLLRLIGKEAFEKSKISSVFIPASVEIIGKEAFVELECLKEIEIAEGINPLTVSQSAFEKTGIENIIIPDRVSSIGENALGSCKKLQNISVDSGNAVYASKEGVLCDVTGKKLIQYPSGKEGTYKISAQVEKIASACFQNAMGLTEITFEEGCDIKDIGLQTFSGCTGLEKITIPDTIEGLGEYSFENCKAFPMEFYQRFLLEPINACVNGLQIMEI